MTSPPNLTFFVELAADRLAEVVQPGVVDLLANRRAAVAMALVDLSPDRAEAVRALEAAGVPVTAWLVLPESEGYWLNADNAERAHAQWLAVLAWGQQHGLTLRTVGLDIEPPHDDTVALVRAPLATAVRLFSRRRAAAQVGVAQMSYATLVAAIQSTGRTVETYQVPLLADERQAATQVLARSLGLVDVRADREVWMLYRSALPQPWGPGLVDAYGPGARAIAIGITGGGVRSLQASFSARELNGAATVLELRRAARFADDLYVFSLEGCVRRGILGQVCAADLRAGPSQTAVLSGTLGRIGRLGFQLGLRLANRLP